MGTDPLAPVWQEVIGWADQFGPLVDLFPFALLLLLKLIWLASGLGVIRYGIRLYLNRRRVEQRRAREGRNGLQEIISRGRISTAANFIQQAAAIVLIGVISILTPQPVRPSVTVFFLLTSAAFVWIAWTSYRIVRGMDASDRDAAAYIRIHAPGVPLLPLDEEG